MTIVMGPTNDLVNSGEKTQDNTICHVTLRFVTVLFFFPTLFLTLWQADNDIFGPKTYLQVIGSSPLT